MANGVRRVLLGNLIGEAMYGSQKSFLLLLADSHDARRGGDKCLILLLGDRV